MSSASLGRTLSTQEGNRKVLIMFALVSAKKYASYLFSKSSRGHFRVHRMSCNFVQL